MIKQQTGDILFVSSTGTATAQWQMKFQGNFANKEGINSKF